MVVWQLTREEGNNYGYARRALRGHSHFVQVSPHACFSEFLKSHLQDLLGQAEVLQDHSVQQEVRLDLCFAGCGDLL